MRPHAHAIRRDSVLAVQHAATLESMIVVAASAWIQGAVGFGYALVSAPVVALVAPDLVPGPIMLSSLVLSLASGIRERHSIDRRGVALALAGRIPGVVLHLSSRDGHLTLSATQLPGIHSWLAQRF